MDPNRDMLEAATDPRVYFAAERTLLAWVRTGLALMGFGFVVARFGLFLHELAAMRQEPVEQGGLSLWFGTALIALGVFVNVWAAIKHCGTVRRLEQGRKLHFPIISLGTAVAVVLALLGMAMAVYLLVDVNL